MTRQSNFVAMILLAIVIIGLNSIVFASEPTPTPTPSPMISLFAEDTCAPPCWFGLIPGESDRHDVIQTFASMRHLLSKRDKGLVYRASVITDPDADEEIGWQLGFHWEDYRSSGQSASYIQIRYDLLSFMSIRVNKEVSLRELLFRFGYPDYVYFGISPYYGQSVMYIIYEEKKIRLEMYLPGGYEQCTFKDMAAIFTVWWISYYSSETAQENNSFTDYYQQDPQPKLLYQPSGTHLIPQNLFEQWLNNKETGLCRDVWDRLELEEE